MNFKRRIFLRISFCVLLLMTISLSCEDLYYSSIPYVRVNFLINLNLYNELSIPGNSISAEEYGYGGVIVFYDGLTYYAYDACCPFEVDQGISVEVDDSGIATCPECGSQFNLWSGGSVQLDTGPASEPLKQYSVSVINSGSTLLITN